MQCNVDIYQMWTNCNVSLSLSLFSSLRVAVAALHTEVRTSR